MKQRTGKKRELLLCWTIVVSILSAFIHVTNTGAAVRYVTSGGRGNCSSWTKTCSLHIALTGASSGDEVWVKAGVHYPVTSGLSDPRTATFLLKYRVAVYGGFNGTETNRNQRNWKINTTVLSGDIDQNDDNGDGNNIAETVEDIKGNNAYHVVTGVNQATLDGFIITAGQADGSADQIGSGMYNSGDPHSDPDHYIHPIVAHCTFIGNWASGSGGGMYNFHSSASVTDSIFSHNEAGNSGGGMYNYVASLSVTGCTFLFNNTQNGTGAGMENYYGGSTVTNCIFQYNSAEGGSGGGVFNYDSGSRLTGCTFSDNTAGHGGGMFNMSNVEDPVISKCTFSNNRANFGGGMENYRSKPTVVNSIFKRNKADDSGGGMYNTANSQPTIINCTFADNITPNSAGGNGMYNANSSNSILRNIIMWDTNSGITQIYNDGSNPIISYSDIQGCIVGGSWNSACGISNGNNIASAPEFVNEASGNLHLKANSPAIDAGICGVYTAPPDSHYIPLAPLDDIDGDKRPSNDGELFGCDIGADEYKPFSWPMFLPAIVRPHLNP